MSAFLKDVSASSVMPQLIGDWKMKILSHEA